MKKLTTTILLLLFLTPVTAVAGTWVIFNGVVEGTLKNFNKLGQYCDDDGRSCVGSKYNKADFSVYQPIRDVKVRVFINGALAGQGTTNTAGYYKISWIYGGYYYPYQIRIETTLEHKGGRFTVFNGNGTPYFLYGYSNIVFLGSSNQNPQNLGTWYWGSANATITASNTYEAAWRTWYYSFRYSSKLRGAFTNLKIFDQSDESTHFEKDAFEIHLNKLSQSYSYHRTAHEMGHAASTRASHPSFKFAGQYCYPSNSEAYGNQICNDPANQGHSLTTQEWASAQFEEGMATFLGTVGAFWSSSHEPRYCFGYSSAPCPPLPKF